MTIQVENLGKRFNREWIFRKLTHTFEQGNTYAITGPNGSGKSTLLQSLWGQLPPSSGKINYTFQDKPLPIEEVFRQVSIATPYMDLIEEYTLQEIIRFHFQFKKVRGSKSPLELLELMELSHAKDKIISNFSSGMRQRVKLALAFYAETSMLFLDEPTTNLDKKSIEWYLKNLSDQPSDRLIFIASNQEHEYPLSAKKIDILAFK